jgi:cell division protein FtsQ
MWDDPRQLNGAALALATLAIVAILAAAFGWLVRQPYFAFREVVVSTRPARASGVHLESVVREQLSGTFFTLDMERARSALGAVPWVRGVALRRQWPGRLEIEIEEHAPLARWNDDGLVGADGEVFIADWNGELPQFIGPSGQAEAMTARYRQWSALLARLDLSVHALTLSQRGGWRIAAAGPQGALTLELGREDPDGRLARFVAAHDRTIGALARAGRAIGQVDLRYRNGFAVRVPGFREKPARKS